MSNERAITTTTANTVTQPNTRTRARTERWTYRPDADIIRRDEDFVITMDLPGVPSEQLDVTVQNNVLEVIGRVDAAYAERYEQQNLLRHEFGVGDYHRQFALSEDVNPEGITADFSCGVLTIRLPKREDARRRRIEITQNG